MRKIIYLLLISLFFVPMTVSAQETELSEDVKEDIKDQAMQQAELYELCMKYLASKRINIDQKGIYKKRALGLFIGNGEEYKSRGSDRTEGPVMTQVSSVNNNNIKRIPTKKYLENLINLNYTDVSMEEAQLVYIDNLKKIDDSTYTSIAHIAMEFVGFRDYRPVYKDITWKDIEIVVIRRETDTRVRFDVKFGDTIVTATERL